MSMNLVLYIVIALVVTLASSLFEMYLNGYVLLSAILGAIWPLTLIAVALAVGLFIAVGVFGVITKCLELVTIKIAKILNISINKEKSTLDEIEEIFEERGW